MTEAHPFIPGLQLAELFYREAVGPVMEASFPGLAYSAARLDYGSDVLGFDSPRSMDHGWGPRVQLFLRPEDCARYSGKIKEAMARDLPFELRGIPTGYASHGDGTDQLELQSERPLRHRVSVSTVPELFQWHLGHDLARPLEALDWLLIPAQKLRLLASGKVFHDGLGSLEPARQSLAWYPHELWLYLLACQWRRIDQEEPFMARCGEAGDEIGSRLVAASQVRELMLLCFLMEKSYPPYAKWLGSAFSRLACAGALGPILEAVLAAATWQAREAALSLAYGQALRMHNALRLTPPLEDSVSPFHSRPYLVPHSSRVVEALTQAIRSPEVLALPRHAGALWQFARSTDLVEEAAVSRAFRGVYVPRQEQTHA